MKIGFWGIGLGLFILASGCNQHKTNEADTAASDSVVTMPDKDTAAGENVDVNTPVASIELNKEDAVTDNDFTVQVFPTHKKDVFTIEIKYGGNAAKDEVTMLPKSYYKEIALRKGKNANECLLGFIDNKGKFNTMKSITASGTHIGIKTVKAYYLSTK